MRFVLVLAVGLALAPLDGTAQDFSALLDDDKADVLIDQLPSDERHLAVRALAGRLDTETYRTAQILCAIRPWTTGDPDRDDALQTEVWRHMSRETSGEADGFRWLDCAAANRDGWYRASSLDPMFNVRQAMCSGWLGHETAGLNVRTIATGMDEFGDRLEVGIRAAFEGQEHSLHSFYPVRNALRIANLRAALAVEVWRNDPERSRSILREAATSLETTLRQLDVARTRNGWRLYNDLEFHSALYSWLSDGDEDSVARLRVFLEPEPVLNNPRLASAISPEILDEMPVDFVDMIYIERLLPGAQLVREDQQDGIAALDDLECDQWHRRSYDPVALAETVLACADTRHDIVAFDTCLVPFEATDWTLQYASARNLSEPQIQNEKQRIERLVEEVLGRIPNETASGMESLLLPVQVERFGSRVVFVAPGELATSQREFLDTVFDRRSSLDPLFRRPRAY